MVPIRTVLRLAALKRSAPQLATRDIDQIAALPLGSRVKLDPWSDRAELIEVKPVPNKAALDFLDGYFERQRQSGGTR